MSQCLCRLPFQEHVQRIIVVDAVESDRTLVGLRTTCCFWAAQWREAAAEFAVSLDDSYKLRSEALSARMPARTGCWPANDTLLGPQT